MTDQSVDEPTFDQSAMIALLPITTDWCKISLPHLTLVYAGDTTKLGPAAFNELAKDACSLAQLTRPITLEVTGKEQFGNWSDNPQDMVDVYRFRATPELLAMRRFVERWNASEFPFNPHVTIGPAGTSMNDQQPRLLAFNRILVGWGADYLTFNMKTSY